MKRYFFHTSDGDVDIDRQGVELAGDDAARDAAIRYAGAMIQDNPKLLMEADAFHVHAKDEDGRSVLTVMVQASSSDN